MMTFERLQASSPAQAHVASLAAAEGMFQSSSEAEQKACRLLNGRGLLRRDPKNGSKWYATEELLKLVGDTSQPVSKPSEPAPEQLPPYQVMPPLTAEDYAALKADIVAHGVLVPVEYDENGNILDGHNRVAICESLGIKDWPRFVRKGLSEEGKRAHALQLNLSRRHLTTAQKRTIVENELRRDPNLSSRSVAALVGVHHSTVSAVRIGMEATGEISQLDTTVGRDGKARRCKPMRTMFLPRREDIGELKAVAKSIRAAEQKQNHEGRLRHMALVAKAGTNTAGPISGKFGVIYADPPWQFGVRSEVTGREKSAENHYPTMPTDEICSLFAEIGSPAARDAVLFLWATNPMIEDGLRVMREWGFAYVHHWIWDKEVAGTGYWGRDRHELLLIGRRGSPATPLMGTQPETVHRERKTQHSAKPGYFAERIEALYPGVPALELFCRSPRPGWTAWGYEAGTVEASP